MEEAATEEVVMEEAATEEVVMEEIITPEDEAPANSDQEEI